MKSSKCDQSKDRSKSKASCSSKQALKFLEKEGFSRLTLNYKGMAASLNDFIPENVDKLKEGLDFEVAKQIKKLEKKDVGTKQKALMDLNDIVKDMDSESTNNMLRYWPKVYNRLSLDEDKRVRELTQGIMSNLADICGKNLGPYIKQLLPTWIFAQSDIHAPAANIAILSFNKTFEDVERRKKAYLLCWKELSCMINNILMKENEIEKEELKHSKSDKKQSILKKEANVEKNDDNNLTILKDQSFEKKNISKAKKQSIITDEELKHCTKSDINTDNIVLHMRTLITLLPYIAADTTASQDLCKWLHSKCFWSHFKLTTCTNVISVYLTFSIDLLTHVPHLILTEPFIISNVTYSFRLIDKYHVNIVPLVWTLIIKSIDTIGDSVWQLVSFPNTFLPRWLNMLECGLDGNISHTSSFMLPFFTKMPVNISSSECLHIFKRIFDAMHKCLNSQRVRNVSHEANCSITMILECATYTVLKAKCVANDVLQHYSLSIIWNLLESYMTKPGLNKATKMIASFCQVALRPLLNKEVINNSDLTQVLTSWIIKYHDQSFFCEKLTELLMKLRDLSLTDSTACKTIMDHTQEILVKYIQDSQNCLLPYLIIISFYDITPSDNKPQLKSVFKQSKKIILKYDFTLITSIALSMANILNYIPNDALELYEDFLSSLTLEATQHFFNEYYDSFINRMDEEMRNLIATKTLTFWTILLSTDFKTSLEDNNAVSRSILPFIFHHCNTSPHHRHHLSDILNVIDSHIAQYIDSSVTDDSNGVIISILRYCLEEIHLHFSMESVPQSMVLNFIKMLICTPCAKDTETDLSQLRLYIEACKTVDIFLKVLDIVFQGDFSECHIVADIVLMLVQVVPKVLQPDLLYHLDQTLLSFIISVESILQYQESYTSAVIPSRQSTLEILIHNIQALLYLQYDSEPSLNQLKISITHCCVLLTPILSSTFSNCFHSIQILQQCESIYTFTEAIPSQHLLHITDVMLISSQFNNCKVDIFDKCPHLTILALRHFIAPSYSQWSDSVLSSVDFAISSWTDCDLSESQMTLMFKVLFPCALRARYLVQEVILASISSYLSTESKPTLACINRALLLIKCLTTTDPSFFNVCYPLLMSVKPKFESHIDQLYDATVEVNVNDETHLNMSSLLEFLITGVDSSSFLDNNKWDFILCLVSTLSRSSQFVNSTDFAVNSINNNTDHLLNSYLLMKLISVVVISLTSINNESILDEWDNFFCEPIFTTVLDLFSFVSGDHCHCKLVSSDIFIFYAEALAEVVSLCPVSVILLHNFHAQIHINDPIELPKNFLIVFNSLLESLSSYSLSTQLAAYNCLLNLTDNLSTLLCEQITKVEDDDSIESFYLTIPHKLLSYLQCDGLIQLPMDKVESEIVLTRNFLAWNVLLHLFSCSKPNVRAELSSFLITHNCCFDKFLSFCFAFMPKNPLINKKSFTFLSKFGKQSCNLISEEPQIFSKCLEHRTKSVIYHLSSFVFRRSLQVLPNLTRCWFMSLDAPSQQQVDVYVRQYITPVLLKIEFEQLKRSIVKDFDDKLEIHALPVIGEVTVRYVVSDDQNLEQVISLPSNYPIGKIVVDFKKELKVKIGHWKSWIIQMTSTMENQNGSILDGVTLWKKNLDKHFEGAQDCMICYSILHAIKYSLPSMKCQQCKKKFHKECMFKWFQSSTTATCPNCRHVFYDGTYRRVQYVENDA